MLRVEPTALRLTQYLGNFSGAFWYGMIGVLLSVPLNFPESIPPKVRDPELR